MTTPCTDNNELQPNDLQVYTRGRLSAEDFNTQDVLNAALQHARNYCKWHVTPVDTNAQLSLDGPGQWGGLGVGIGGLHYPSGSFITGSLRRQRIGAETLYLPTKRLTGISAIVENGVALDVSTDIEWSTDGEVWKTSGLPWTASRASGRTDGTKGISVTFTHGYSPAEAVDWRRLVLSIADRMSMVKGLVGPFNAAVGPYRLSAFYGTSRAGTMPMTASWLDDLTSLFDTRRYVRVDV